MAPDPAGGSPPTVTLGGGSEGLQEMNPRPETTQPEPGRAAWLMPPAGRATGKVSEQPEGRGEHHLFCLKTESAQNGMGVQGAGWERAGAPQAPPPTGPKCRPAFCPLGLGAYHIVVRREAEGVLLAQQPAVGVVLAGPMPVRPAVVVGEHLRQARGCHSPALLPAHAAWRPRPTGQTDLGPALARSDPHHRAARFGRGWLRHASSMARANCGLRSSGRAGPETEEKWGVLGQAKRGREGAEQQTGRVDWDPRGHPRASASVPRGCDEAQGSAC